MSRPGYDAVGSHASDNCRREAIGACSDASRNVSQRQTGLMSGLRFAREVESVRQKPRA